MKHGTRITDLPSDVFGLVVDRLLSVYWEDGRHTDFACLRLSSRGMHQLSSYAALRRLDLHNCSGDDMQHLLGRFTCIENFTGGQACCQQKSYSCS
jgi:hypothetical protein